MLEINIRFSCRVAILAACLFNVGVRAENLPAERPTLAAEVRHEEGAGLLPTDRAYITAGTNKFAFLVPAEFRLDFVNETALELVTRDYSSRIGFKILPPQSAEAGDMTADLCSSWVTQQSPGGKIIRSFDAFADSQKGVAVQVSIPGPAGSWRLGQYVFVPSRGKILQFSLTSSPEKFESARQKLNTVLLTFRASDEHGRLNISPISDKL